MKKVNTLTVVQVILILGAVIALLYPVVSSHYFLKNNYTVIADFEDKAEGQRKIDEYRELNSKVTNDNFYTEDPFSRYKEIETTTQEAIGVLHIPQIGEELAIYETTNTLSLAVGVGMLDGTHYPTGGINNTTVVTGHRGTSNATILQHLDKLELGDIFWINNGVEDLYYQVYDSKTVLPHQTDELRVVEGKDVVILLTCDTPDIKQGINTHRLLVYAERVDKPVELPTEVKVDKSLKFKLLATAAGVILLIGVVLVYKELR